MTDFFYGLLKMSIEASWLIAVVILLRFLFRKIPRKLVCCLWALVALRLICPLTIESSLSLVPDMSPKSFVNIDNSTDGQGAAVNMNGANGNFKTGTAGSIAGGNTAGVTDRLTGNLTGNSAGSTTGRLTEGSTGTTTSTSNTPADGFTAGASEIMQADGTNGTKITDMLNAASIVWLAGVVILLGYALITYMRIRRRTLASVNMEKNVYLCDDIETPFILGVFRTKIFIPSKLSLEDRGYVLAHENAHLKRLDNIWKPLGYVVLMVHWFNPLVWISYILMCRDIEIACDERVIADKDTEYKKQYATTLLNCSSDRNYVTACPLAFGEVGVKQRIKAVLNYKKPAFWVVIVAVVVCVATAAGFMTSPKSNENNGTSDVTPSEEVTTQTDENTSEPAGTEDSPQTGNEENQGFIEYDGWRIEFVPQDNGWEGSFSGNELTITNTENSRSVRLVPFDESGNLVKYEDRIESNDLSVWGIEKLTGNGGGYSSLGGGVEKISYYTPELGSSGEEKYGRIIIYGTALSDTIWYMKLSSDFSVYDMDDICDCITAVSTEYSVDDSEEYNIIRYYDKNRPLSVYEQYELAENKMTFLSNAVTDDDGNLMEYDGNTMRAFELLDVEMETENPEYYEKLMNPVSSAGVLFDIEYTSYRLYNFSIAGANSRQIVEFTLEDGSRRAICMENTGTLGLWRPFFEYEAGSEGYQEIISVNEYMDNVTAERLKNVDNVCIPGESYKYADLSDDFVILDSVPDSDIALYGIYGGYAMMLRDGEHLIPIWLSWMSPQMHIPRIYYGDYDNDGIFEFALKTHMTTGTGISGDELYIIEAGYASEQSGKLNYDIKEFNDWYDDVAAAVNYSVDDTGNIVTITLYGEEAAVIDLTQHFEEHKEYREEFDGFNFGSHYYFENRDGEWYFTTYSGLCVKRNGESLFLTWDNDWNYSVVVTGRVVYEQSSGCRLEDITVSVEERDE